MKSNVIETHYKGYRFRSRLEARWAVFFDACHLVWQYEPEGFVVFVTHTPEGKHGNVPYLPDFYLPELNAYVEIKGDAISELELDKCEGLYEATNKAVFIVRGIPGEHTGQLFCFVTKDSGAGIESWPAEFVKGRDNKTYLVVIGPTKDRQWWLENWSDDGRECELIPFPSVGAGSIIVLPYNEYRMARSARFEFGESGN